MLPGFGQCYLEQSTASRHDLYQVGIIVGNKSGLDRCPELDIYAKYRFNSLEDVLLRRAMEPGYCTSCTVFSTKGSALTGFQKL